jgi:hypothetical protein
MQAMVEAVPITAQVRCGPDGMQGALAFLCDFWHEAA